MREVGQIRVAKSRSLDFPVVGDYMVRNPTCAELWQPVSFIRQQMLANSFSFLPVRRPTDWCIVSDLDIAIYLGTDTSKRRQHLAKSLNATGIVLQEAKFCTVDTPLDEALSMLNSYQKPLLVSLKDKDQNTLVGIVTSFDLL